MTSSLQFKRKPISFLVEVKAIREDCPPGKVVYCLTCESYEERKKVLSSISTSFPRRWKSRPAQRITGANATFVSPTKKSSLTISPSFPAEPPLFAIRSTTSAFPFYNIPSRPHCSSKCATPYEDLLPFCPLSVHAVLKAEEDGWAAGTTSPLSHTSIQKQV